jgi:hypothetical protein
MNGLIPGSLSWTIRAFICRSGFSRDVGAGLVPAFFVCHVMIAAEAAPTGEILNTLDYYIMQSERGETQIMILTS